MILRCVAPPQRYRVPHSNTVCFAPRKPSSSSSPPDSVTLASSSLATTRRGALSLSFISVLVYFLSPPSSSSAISDFSELRTPAALGLWTSALVPAKFPPMATRLAAKQGWRFDSTYDHKNGNGEPVTFVFVLGSGKVISGIEAAVSSMKVGGIRRVIIPPSQGYQNTSQELLPPNFIDRQRLFTIIFNPTLLAHGEGSPLGTLSFDIELLSLRHP